MAENDNTQESVENDQPEYTAIEQEALAQGWVPKSEFTGDESRFIDAGEFVRRGELFSKIEAQGKELKATRQAIAKLAEHNKRIAQASYEQARKDLLAEKKTAYAEGDVDRIVEIEEQLEVVKEQARHQIQQAQQEATTEVNQLNPVFTEWTAKNAWYGKDSDLTDWADGRGVRLAREGLDPAAVLRQIEREAKEKFPDKFTNPKRARAGAVEGAQSVRPGGKAGYQLTPQEERICKTIVDTGVMTRDEYIKQMKALNENK